LRVINSRFISFYILENNVKKLSTKKGPVCCTHLSITMVATLCERCVDLPLCNTGSLVTHTALEKLTALCACLDNMQLGDDNDSRCLLYGPINSHLEPLSAANTTLTMGPFAAPRRVPPLYMVREDGRKKRKHIPLTKESLIIKK
jgi:hypothetical protein